jgi:hypothetical protein
LEQESYFKNYTEIFTDKAQETNPGLDFLDVGKKVAI